MWKRRRNLFSRAEQVPDPRKARGVRHPFQAILRLTLLGLVSRPNSPGQLHWQTLKEPLELAGVPFEQLQQALIGWVEGMVEDRPLDGKWANSPKTGDGECQDLKLCLAMTEKRYEPKVLRAQLGQLSLSGPPLYAERDL